MHVTCLVSRLAEELLESVQHLSENMTSSKELSALQQAVNDVVSKIVDLQSHITAVNERLATARLMNNTNQQQIKTIKVLIHFG
jgi:predicted  nucleic acid-binding Zn-ribbon protein